MDNAKEPHHHQDKPIRIIIVVFNISNAQNTEDICCGLQKAAEGNNPAIRFSMNEHLDKVCESGESKEYGKEISGWQVGTEVRPCALWIRDGCKC